MTVTLTDNKYTDASGKKFDRVTSICKLAYVDDPFQFVKPADLDKASARGSAIHRLTSDEANQDGDDEWQNWAEGWLNFKSDTGYVEIGAEKPVHSEIYQFAGTPDSWGIMPALLKTQPRAGVVEKKTTATLPLIIGLQTAPYRAALNEMYPRGITPNPSLQTWEHTARAASWHFTERWVVWLRPNFPRGYKLISEGDLMLVNGKRVPILSPTDWQTFIGLLMVKRWRERYLKPITKKENRNAGEPTDIEWR